MQLLMNHTVKHVMFVIYFIWAVQSYDYYIAEFSSDIQGLIQFTPTDQGVEIQINLQGNRISHNHNYHIHEAVVESNVNCTEAGQHFDPLTAENPGYLCDPNNLTSCFFGDLSGKHGTLDLDTAPLILTELDTQLSLSDLENRSIVIHGEDLAKSRIACASLVGGFFPDFMGAQFADEYYGSIVFRPRSDGSLGIVSNFDSALATTQGHRYHVHTNAISGGDCYSAGGHFDPLGQESLYTFQPCNPADQGTCYKGDLSGKYGMLELPSQRSVQDLQLSIRELAARSLVIHESDGGLGRILCDTLRAEPELRDAVALFAGAVAGRVRFRTNHDGTVQINTELALPAGASAQHKFHVHVDNVIGADCGSAGGHYDPAGVEVAGYACDPNNVATCYQGDISGKFGLLDFPNSLALRDKQLKVKEIVGRSLVIHAQDGSRMACASILPAADLPKLAIAQFSSDDVTGFLTMREQPDGRVAVIADLQHATASTNHKLHIHTDPVPPNAADCSVAGGHFDPFGVEVQGYSCNPQDVATCYVGDISGKHGFYNIPSQTVVFDTQIEIASVIQRSIVIHAENLGGPRIACATIDSVLATNYAEATFAGNVFGTVSFTQMAGHVLLSLRMAHSHPTLAGVTWKIIEGSACSAAAAAWNPAGVLSACDARDPATCAAGDLGAKHGDLPLNARTRVADETFALTGALGRALVVSDGSHTYCANILPKVYEPEVLAAKFDMGLVLFRPVSSGGSSMVSSFLAPLPFKAPSTGNTLALAASCEPAAAPSAAVDFPGYDATAISIRARDLLGMFVILNGTECREIEALQEAPALSAVARFSGAVSGQIDFGWDNASLSTGVTVSLANADGGASKRHKIHVHADAVPAGAACSAAAGHYDPFAVEVAGYSCDPDTNSCYVGDLSGRYEQKISLPLSTWIEDAGMRTSEILGRSIVIHAAEDQGPRIACATIFPIPEYSYAATAAPAAAPTGAPTLRPTGRPTTPRPTRQPTLPTLPAATEGAIAERESNAGGGGAPALVIALAVLLPLCLLCLCAGGFFYWREQQYDDVFKHRGLPVDACDCLGSEWLTRDYWCRKEKDLDFGSHDLEAPKPPAAPVGGSVVPGSVPRASLTGSRFSLREVANDQRPPAVPEHQVWPESKGLPPKPVDAKRLAGSVASTVYEIPTIAPNSLPPPQPRNLLGSSPPKFMHSGPNSLPPRFYPLD